MKKIIVGIGIFCYSQKTNLNVPVNQRSFLKNKVILFEDHKTFITFKIIIKIDRLGYYLHR